MEVAGITITVPLVVDLLLLSLIAYMVLSFLRGTKAVQLLKGLLVLVALTGIAKIFSLPMLEWTLDKVWVMAVVAIPVIFQPELRSMLEKLGRGRPFARLMQTEEPHRFVIAELVEAAREMGRRRMGALIVLERETGLKEYVESGIQLDSVLSRLLLLQIFQKDTPMHDGAVIIKGDRVLAASCYLPLSSNTQLSKQLGARHRAAVGITEQSDALVVVVSEETGIISVAEDGNLTRFLDPPALRRLLQERLSPESSFVWRIKST